MIAILLNIGASSCVNFLCNSALCLGAGIDKTTALKVGACLAAGSAIAMATEKFPQKENNSQRPVQNKENRMLGRFCQVVKIASIAVSWRRASLILGSSIQVAKWAMITKAISMFVESGINYVIDGIAQKDRREELKLLANVLIFSATLGVIARIAGSSNKVAVLATAIFGVLRVLSFFIPQRILKSNISQITKVFLSYIAIGSLTFSAGRALRPLLSQ